MKKSPVVTAHKGAPAIDAGDVEISLVQDRGSRISSENSGSGFQSASDRRVDDAVHEIRNAAGVPPPPPPVPETGFAYRPPGDSIRGARAFATAAARARMTEIARQRATHSSPWMHRGNPHQGDAFSDAYFTPGWFVNQHGRPEMFYRNHEPSDWGLPLDHMFDRGPHVDMSSPAYQRHRQKAEKAFNFWPGIGGTWPEWDFHEGNRGRPKSPAPAGAQAEQGDKTRDSGQGHAASEQPGDGRLSTEHA